MQDRQLFERHDLSNGMTVYSHAMDVPFFSMHVVLPVGSVHSHEKNKGGKQGIAHFLEHMVFKRSKRYPELLSFERAAALKGATVNASTSAFHTDVYAHVPASAQDLVVQGLVSQIFEPIFRQEDVAIECGVIANERNQRRYYPGNSELQNYLKTKWESDLYYSKEQLFGGDTDLSEMDTDILLQFHKAYASPKTAIIVAGGHDVAAICSAFSNIPTKEVSLIEQCTLPAWVKREYHEHTFKDINSPLFYYGGILPGYDIETHGTLNFMLEFLLNSSHGPIYEWTRNQMGWTYGARGGASYDRDRLKWSMDFPVNNIEYIQPIRDELYTRIGKALGDQKLVDTEIERQLSKEVFSYQTASSRANEATEAYTTIGRIPMEKEHRESLHTMKSLSKLQKAFTRCFNPNITGEFAALPEQKTI